MQMHNKYIFVYTLKNHKTTQLDSDSILIIINLDVHPLRFCYCYFASGVFMNKCLQFYHFITRYRNSSWATDK